MVHEQKFKDPLNSTFEYKIAISANFVQTVKNSIMVVHGPFIRSNDIEHYMEPLALWKSNRNNR